MNRADGLHEPPSADPASAVAFQLGPFRLGGSPAVLLLDGQPVPLGARGEVVSCALAVVPGAERWPVTAIPQSIMPTTMVGQAGRTRRIGAGGRMRRSSTGCRVRRQVTGIDHGA